MRAMSKVATPPITQPPACVATPSCALDRAEQLLVLVLWSALVARVLASSNGHGWMAAASEAAVLLLVLVRRPGQAISHRAGDWMMALAATIHGQVGKDLADTLFVWSPKRFGLDGVVAEGQLRMKGGGNSARGLTISQGEFTGAVPEPLIQTAALGGLVKSNTTLEAGVAVAGTGVLVAIPAPVVGVAVKTVGTAVALPLTTMSTHKGLSPA